MDGIYDDIYIHIVIAWMSLIVNVLLLSPLTGQALELYVYSLEIAQSCLKDISRSSGVPKYFIHKSLKEYQISRSNLG